MSWLNTKGTAVEVTQSFWIINGLFVKAHPALITEISNRSDVKHVFHNGTVKIVTAKPSLHSLYTKDVEWGVTKVEAPTCWADGYTGEGIIIGIVDTGVDYLHPALEGKWAGHWFVATGLPASETPYDDNKHGTHCVGSILGGDGSGAFSQDIGVAPGAKYVAAKGLNGGGSGSSNQLIECLEFMADLKEQVDIKAVSNSWACGNGNQQFYWEAFLTLRSIGILPIVANGNNGSQGAASVTSPGDYPHVIGVGATDKDDNIGSFSSLGPTVETEPYNDKSLWLRDDWNYIKPNISAPGVSINSAIPGGEYGSLNGTSMATPHVCGAVALLYQKNINLTHEMVYNLLLDNVDKPSAGGPYPNNTFGWGRLNAWKSLQATPTMNQPWVYVTQKSMASLEPGKTIDLAITVKNLGGSEAFQAAATLFSLNNYVSVSNAAASFGDLAPKEEGSNSNNPFKITAHSLTPQGHVATLGIVLQADGELDTLDFKDTITFAVSIGTAPEPQRIFVEDFEYTGTQDSFAILWETDGNWGHVNNASHSQSHSLYSGDVIDGHEYSTMKNTLDLSRYSKVYFSFWTQYNFDNIFWTKALVEISSDGGSTWNEIWNSPRFSNQDSISWEHQVNEITPYLSEQVKFRTNLESKGVFQDYAHWYIDDMEIFVETDNEPPYLDNTSVWQATAETGPFIIHSTITDASGVKKALLHYKVGAGSWNTIAMTERENHLYDATIPAQQGSGTINYYLEAEDNWFLSKANVGTAPVGASKQGGFYSFKYGTTGIREAIDHVQFNLTNTMRKHGQMRMQFFLPQPMGVRLKVHDAKGRQVALILNKKLGKGNHSVTWGYNKSGVCNRASGLYFITFQANIDGGNHSKAYNKIVKVLMVD